MTDEQSKALAAYIATIQTAMRLDHWKIVVADKPAAEGKDATVHCIEDRHIAHIQFASDFFTMKPDEQREIVIHELIHIHNAKVDDAVLTIRAPLGEQVWPFLWTAYRHADEYATDALTAVLAPFLPLPAFTPPTGG